MNELVILILLFVSSLFVSFVATSFHYKMYAKVEQARLKESLEMPTFPDFLYEGYQKRFPDGHLIVYYKRFRMLSFILLAILCVCVFVGIVT